MNNVHPYQPRDTMTIWWLGRPESPVKIGRISFVSALRAVGMQYDADWIAHGFPISEDLPLRPIAFFPTVKDTAVGAVDDARPDRWGERVIRLLDRPPRTSLMEYLYFAGDDRFGAMGISLSDDFYEPHLTGPLPRLEDIQCIQQTIDRLLSSDKVDDRMARLINPGASMGGARPKALIQWKDAEWVLKFREPGEFTDTPLIEHASMTLAKECQIQVAETCAIKLSRGHAIAVKRFDRENGHRVHCLSAAVVLRACGEDPGYSALALWLRRKGSGVAGQAMHDRQELFRRMVFNILIDNNDDHEKNHVVRMSDDGSYHLSPAFDVLPTGQALGFQLMRVGTLGAESTLVNALSEHALFGLTKEQALQEIGKVANCVDRWMQHFKKCGVSDADMDMLAAQIDRPFLREQRREWLVSQPKT